jgi:hypothetical protein
MDTIGMQLQDINSPQYSIKFSENSPFIPEKTSRFFHYTSFDLGISILSDATDSIEIWPSHLLYSNDSQEYNEGIELIRELFNSLERNFSPKVKEDFFKILYSKHALEKEVYITCFSNTNDSLTHWKYYGKGCGLAIEFNLDQNEVRFSGLSVDRVKVLKEQRYAIGPFKVIYEHDDKIKIIQELFNQTLDISENLTTNQSEKDRIILSELSKLVGFCPLFKNQKFKEEHESRIIFRPHYEEDEFEEIPKLIYYRSHDGRIKPHLKVKLHKRYESNDIKLINSICIGPGNNQTMIFNALEHLVKRKPGILSDTHITMSKIPFRA